jgi:thioester reductase-like protein
MSFTESIFLTGFPGFIASRLVEKLAKSYVQFFLLVQPRFLEKAMSEIQTIAARTETPVDNFALIEGDITKTNFGADVEDLDTLRKEVTDIYHLAAAYDLAVEKDLAFRVNLEGTRHVNDFAETVENLRRFNYISTCYVAGMRTGKIFENELEHKEGFRNYYEETKYLAELEVEKLKEILPVTIFRPSVVVGDSQTGETTKYDGIYYLIHYLRKSPGLLRLFNVGNKKVRLNLVPVDFVVDGIAALSHDEKATGKTIALADPNPLTTAELFDTIAASMTGKSSVVTPPPAIVEWSLLRSFSPPITGLPHYAVPYFFIEQVYDTNGSKELLAEHGVKCPSFKEYAGNLLKFVGKYPKL